MKIAYSSNGFPNHSLAETLRRLAQIGFDGVEIIADTPHAFPLHLTSETRQQLKETLAKTGLAVSNISAFTMNAVQDAYHPSWIEPEKRLRDQRLAHTIRCIELAAELGAKNISTEPGGPPDEDMSRELAMDLFIQGIDRVVPTARQAGVRILVEPRPALLIQTSKQFLSFIEEVDGNMVGLNCGIGHFYCAKEDPAEVIQTLRDYIGHFQVEDVPATRELTPLPLGSGAVDFPRVVAAIRGIGYDSFLTLHVSSSGEDAPQAAETSLAFLHRLLAQPGPMREATAQGL